MTHPWGSKIQVMEKAKRRHNRLEMKGALHAKGTMPRVYFRPKEIVQEVRRETWFDRLRARIKALWGKNTKKSYH